MDKILVTGAAGFLASRFCEFYKDSYKIIPVKRIDLDIRDENKVIEFIKEVKPNYVLHTAAVADTKKCEDDKETSYNINVLGSKNVAKGCSLTGAKLIHLSTEQLFNGNNEAGPYTEESVPMPNTTYGKHKLQAEKEISSILEQTWILRLTWLFGFQERFKKVNPNVILNVIAAALKGKKLRVSINEFRGMTYVYELLKNMPSIMEIPFGIYHTGSENNLSAYETAEIVVEELGLSYRMSDIIEKDEDRFRDLPRDIRISNKKLKNLGIEFLSTEEAIKQCIDEFGMGF